jgi:hypothetical protein
MKASRPRKYVAIREKWAAALSMLLPQELRDELRKKQVPAKTIIAMFDQDHVVFHVWGGADRWWNFTPMLRPEHREKSRRDKSTISKVDRLMGKTEEHFEVMRRKLLAPAGRVMACVQGNRCFCDDQRRERCGNWREAREKPSRWGKRPFHRSG